MIKVQLIGEAAILQQRPFREAMRFVGPIRRCPLRRSVGMIFSNLDFEELRVTSFRPFACAQSFRCPKERVDIKGLLNIKKKNCRIE